MIDTGDTAPDVTLDLGDMQKKLSAFRGAPLVLYFYPKDDTPGCTTEAQAFSALLPEFERAGIKVVGVSKDSVAAHARFAAKRALTVPLASDFSGEVCEAFGVWVEKSMYGKRYMGIERATFLIAADGRIAHVWHKVKVAGHAGGVLDEARKLTA